MIGNCILVLLFSAVAVLGEDFYQIDTFNHDEGFGAAREPQDRFRLMASNIDDQRIQDEIDDLTSYSCEKMVVIRNRAQEQITLNCSTDHDNHRKPIIVQPGKAFIFTFKARRNGKTKFWCNVEYKFKYARFDVYNEAMPYMCPRSIDEIYQYTVNHDGVHVDEANGNGGTKIRSLFKGHNKFILWEQFLDNETDGLLYSGLVDGGMCDDIPEQFNDKTKAVTICYNHCVHLYEHFGCTGKMQTVQASDDCLDFPLHSELVGKLSAVKGC